MEVPKICRKCGGPVKKLSKRSKFIRAFDRVVSGEFDAFRCPKCEDIWMIALSPCWVAPRAAPAGFWPFVLTGMTIQGSGEDGE